MRVFSVAERGGQRTRFDFENEIFMNINVIIRR